IPPVPFILAIIPLYISVVAFPKIFGETIAKIVLPTAKIKAKIISILYSLITFKNFFKVPLKSLAFSVAPGALPIFLAIRVPPPLIVIEQFLYKYHKFLVILYVFHFQLFLLHLKQ